MRLAAAITVFALGIAVPAVAGEGTAQGPGQQGAQVRQREQAQSRTKERARRREIIPGSELMTSKERDHYRQRMAAAATDAEREKLRAEHVKAMQERARMRGLQLPDPITAAPEGGKK